MPPVFPADWPSGCPDGWISLEWESSHCHPLGSPPPLQSLLCETEKVGGLECLFVLVVLAVWARP